MIPISDLEFKGNEVKYVTEAARSTWISSLGEFITSFENQLAAFLGAGHGVSVNNGTSALLLALKALNIGMGDEVILPSFTFAATVNAVLHAGATPVLVDSESTHWNIDPCDIEKAITSKTKVIIPVHLYGHPCDMDSILKIAQKHELQIIEDAAEALGAECLGKKLGTIGTIGCFSFYGNKVMTTGEGGACITNDDALNHKLRKLRDHGMSTKYRYWHDEVGYNLRMTNLNAAVGLAQLEQLKNFLNRRSFLAKIYDGELAGISGIRKTQESFYGSKIDWLYCLFLDESSAISRDQLIDQLKKTGIESRPTFYPIHIMPPYLNLRKIGDLKNAERFGRSGLNLPLFPSLEEEQVYYICQTIRKIFSDFG
jgi:perosamine synthetase